MHYFDTLIEVPSLVTLIENSNPIVVDCRFDFEDREAARYAYERGHIPSAVYAHLEDDLCGPPITDHGRHPLPSAKALVYLFANLGISEGIQVVAYDDANGAAAARLWWMLRYMGHKQAAVLNGGFPAWKSAGHPVVPGIERNIGVKFSGQPNSKWVVMMENIDAQRLLIDSRIPERYRGEIEPIDPIPGHIPGAVNHPFLKNFGPDGRFLPPQTLREQLIRRLGDVPPEDATYYCGSGVTACNNLLAMTYSGLGDGRLYVGSYSEWCRYPNNPIAVGDEGDT